MCCGAVDDNKTNRTVLARVLRGLTDAIIEEREDGTEVGAARQPQARRSITPRTQAVVYCKVRPPSMIFMDR